LIIVSHEIARAFFSNIPGAAIDPASRYWGVPCNNIDKLSNITFSMGGVELSLTPEEYMIPTYLMRVSCIKRNSHPQFDIQLMQLIRFIQDNLYRNGRYGLCLSYIHGFDTSNLGCDMLLGQKFLERYVTVYDYEQNRIGI
jgi:hypothetical protein